MKPQPGQQVEIAITDVAYGGDGVGRVDGFVVFVPFTLAGETVRATIRRRKKQCFFAELDEIVTPSAHRVVPRCQYYQLCGGCQYQHASYDEQLRIKTKQLRDMLAHLGGFGGSVAVLPMEGSPRQWRFRNRIDLHPDGSDGYGFCIRNRSRQVFTLHDCPLFELERDFSDYPLRKPGHLLVVRTHSGRPYCYFKTDHNEVASGPFDLDSGGPLDDDVMWFEIGGKRFSLRYQDFFQVNRWVLPVFIERVREVAALHHGDTLLDVYCGTGLFGLSLAGECARVLGVEALASSIEAAQANARALGITNASFTAAPAEEYLHALVVQGAKADVCIVDPPRNGLTNKVVSCLKKLRPRTLVYISCGPDTFMRDARKFVEAGYAFESVRPLDLFPQTKHFELVARFARQEGGDETAH